VYFQWGLERVWEKGRDVGYDVDIGGSTPRGPEDDSVESKHVVLLSHYTLYIVSIYYCCV
jgi:hypothetical protein